MTDYKLKVTGIRDDAGWADYKKKFTLAAEAGEAPDIVLSGHEDVPVWANAGYIVEFTECKARYPEFDDVIESLWDSTMWQGKIWAVPQDTEARPMFFNKTKLQELGWSEEEIAALPDRIRTGDFTLDDLIATAKEAVEKGVVEPGYGYWHRPRKGGDFLQYYFSYGGRLYDPEQDKLVVVRDALENGTPSSVAPSRKELRRRTSSARNGASGTTPSATARRCSGTAASGNGRTGPPTM